MGLVKRQGIKRSIVDYAGVSIGMLSVFFVYPLVIEAYGVISFLRSSAILLAAFAALGLDSIGIRFFPDFKDESGKHNGFLTLLLLIAVGTFLLLLVFWVGFKDELTQFYTVRTEEGLDLMNCYALVLPLAFFLVLIKMLTAFCSNFQRIVVPGIINDFFIKVAVPALCLLFFFNWIDLTRLVQTYFWVHLVVVVGLLIYLRTLQQLRISWPTARVWAKIKEIATYASFNILGNVGAALTQQMDVFMMGNLTDARNTGSYDLGLRLVSPLNIPQRAIMSITGPLVADGIRREDWPYIRDMYQRAALNLLAFASGLFLLLFLNLDDLSVLLPKGEVFNTLKPVVFILGMVGLFDMATSFNGHLITYSRYYKANVVFIVFLGVLNTVLNLLLIPAYGMTGAALATAISMIGYNLAKLFFVRFKFGFWPFSASMWYLIGLALGFGLLFWWLPLPFSALLNIGLRSALIIAAYALSLWYLPISPDVRELMEQGIARVKALIRRD